jgi:hypothetical protein
LDWLHPYRGSGSVPIDDLMSDEYRYGVSETPRGIARLRSGLVVLPPKEAHHPLAAGEEQEENDPQHHRQVQGQDPRVPKL